MKGFREWILVAGLLAGLPTLGAEVEKSLASDNLVFSSRWAARADSTQSIIRVENEWIDPAGFSDEARFYKIQDIE